MIMENETIYSVLKYNDDNNNECYIFSTIPNNSDDNEDELTESYYYYSLYWIDKYPVIKDINNPIDTLKNINTKIIDVKEDTYEYIKFLAYKNLAKNNIIKMSH